MAVLSYYEPFEEHNIYAELIIYINYTIFTYLYLSIIAAASCDSYILLIIFDETKYITKYFHTVVNLLFILIYKIKSITL